jgi:hypothetical protein
MLEDVATRFESSYGPDASRPVTVADKEWGPTMRLINDYTQSDFAEG